MIADMGTFSRGKALVKAVSHTFLLAITGLLAGVSRAPVL
jgi:hypothetical protein